MKLSDRLWNYHMKVIKGIIDHEEIVSIYMEVMDNEIKKELEYEREIRMIEGQQALQYEHKEAV